jgi:hypothetical protein
MLNSDIAASRATSPAPFSQKGRPSHKRGSSLSIFTHRSTSALNFTKSSASSHSSSDSHELDQLATLSPRHSRSRSTSAIATAAAAVTVFNKVVSPIINSPSMIRFRSKSHDRLMPDKQVKGEEQPDYWVERLRNNPCAQLRVEEVGRLRGRLRNETTS